MKKILLLIIVLFTLAFSSVYASEINTQDGLDAEIPEMKFERLIQIMEARKAKVDIIKKNNKEITTLKEELKTSIVEAANRVNELKIDVSNDSVIITNDVVEELKELLAFIQESKKTLEEDVEKISNEIENILDLISTRGMDLEQYDLLIEKQNEVIIEMKNIMQTVSKI